MFQELDTQEARCEVDKEKYKSDPTSIGAEAWPAQQVHTEPVHILLPMHLNIRLHWTHTQDS